MALGTLVVRIVDPDNGPGTHYTSLVNWGAAYGDIANQGDCVGEDQIARALCRCTGGSPLNLFGIGASSQWTTVDAEHYIDIYVDRDYMHSGVYVNSGNVVRQSPTSNGPTMYHDHIHIDGFAVAKTTGSSGLSAFRGLSGGTLRGNPNFWVVKNCVIDGTGTSGSGGIFEYGISNQGGSQLSFSNCIGYGFAADFGSPIGLVATPGQDTCEIYNCVFANSTGGYWGMIEAAAKNCIFWNCVNAAFGSESVPAENEYNGFGGGTGALFGTNQVDLSAYSATDIFVNPSGNDFRIKSSAPGVIMAGTDLSTDSRFVVTDDMFGTPRFAPYDLGANQVSFPYIQKFFRRAAPVTLARRAIARFA